jgi:hypothetical protein
MSAGKNYTIRKMAGLFGVSGGAYYWRAKYGVSEQRKEADAELVELIRLIAAERHRRCGRRFAGSTGNG